MSSKTKIAAVLSLVFSILFVAFLLIIFGECMMGEKQKGAKKQKDAKKPEDDALISSTDMQRAIHQLSTSLDYEHEDELYQMDSDETASYGDEPIVDTEYLNYVLTHDFSGT